MCLDRVDYVCCVMSSDEAAMKYSENRRGMNAALKGETIRDITYHLPVYLGDHHYLRTYDLHRDD